MKEIGEVHANQLLIEYNDKYLININESIR